jgi:predicted LPLAT superfamily acyltransferase
VVVAIDPGLAGPAPPRKTAEWIVHHERGSAAFLRIMAFLSMRLGRSQSRIPLYCIAAYFFLFAPRARRDSRRYLRLALGREPRALDRFRHILHFATTIHDRVYLLNSDYEEFEITIEGEPLMRDLLAGGQGALLIGAHMGSFEVIGSIGRRQPGLHVSMVMYEENARKINSILAAVNPEITPDIISLGHLDAMMQIADRLDRGAFVGLLGDRTLGEEPVQEVAILGRRASLPTGPMRAAAILRRPVIFTAGLYRGGNRYHVAFEPVADFSAVTPRGRDAAVRVAIERYAALLDEYCRSDPYNWFNFFDFWQAPGPSRRQRRTPAA